MSLVRRSPLRRGLTALAATVPVVLPLALSATPAAAQGGYTTRVVVGGGLFNPRGITFGPDGALYVSEAGSGAGVVDPSAPNPPPGITEIAPPFPTVYYAPTSAVTRIDLSGGAPTRVVTNLPSLAASGGGGATGLSDIAFDGSGNAFGVTGWVNDPGLRAGFNDGGGNNIGNQFSRLVSLDTVGNSFSFGADIGAFESANNPDAPNAELNSNPVSLTALSSGGFAVVDAGANALYSVNGSTVSLITAFPQTPNPIFPGTGGPTFQAVPTAVAEGAGGLLFVSELTGFPFLAGTSDIYVVDPNAANLADRITRTLTGFNAVIDLAFNPVDQQLYVLQFGSNGLGGSGRLLRVNPNDGTRTTLIDSGLTAPGGLAISSNGTVYISNLGVAPGGGQILAVTAVPEPGAGVLLLAGSAGAGLIGLPVLRRRRRGA